MKSSILFIMNKYFSISGMVICCKSEVPIEASRLFTDFYCEPAAPDITVNIFIGRLPEAEAGAYMNCLTAGKELRFSCKTKKAADEYDVYIDCSGRLWDYMIFYALDFAPFLLEYGRVMCHCSYIIRDGEAILFAGFKQVGKSTQAELWKEYGGAEIINGDRAILTEKGGRLFACGTPYCGSSKIALNRIAPVRAIILLSKGSENTVSFVADKSERMRLILPHLSYDSGHIDEVLTMAQKMCVTVPFYNYSCLPEKEAVSVMEKILWKL